jgi:hypothetical protein
MNEILANDAFRELIARLPGDVAPSSPVSVDLLFEGGILLRLTARPSASFIIIEAFAADASDLRGSALQTLLEILLSMNRLGLDGGRFAAGVDDNGFIGVFTQAPLSGLEPSQLLDHIDRVAEWARKLRALVSTIADAAASKPANPASP